MALFVTHSPRVGGAEIVLGRYLEAAAGSHHVLVLSSGDCPDYFRSLGVEVTALEVLDRSAGTSRDLGRAAAMREALGTAAGLRRVVAAIRASGQRVVVTNSMKAHVLVPGAARMLRRPVGIRLHDVMAPEATSSTARRLLRNSARLAVSTACVSEAAARAARDAGVPRVVSFPNGVAIPDQLAEPDPGPPLRLLAVSQLARWKGVHDVLETLARVRAEGLDAHLDVLGSPLFGDEAYAVELRSKTAELGLEDAVVWHGHTDPEPFRRAAHVLVHLPLEPDPLPTTLIEALADGLPVVASATGGIPEIVTDGEDGLLVPPGDTAAAAAAVARLADPVQRLAFREAAVRHARERFSVEVYVQRFDDWIESVGRREAVAA